MKISKLLFILIILLSGLYILRIGPSKASNIEGCLNISGAEFVKSEVEGHANIKSQESIEKILVNLFNSMEYNGEYTLSENEELMELHSRANGIEIKILGRKMLDKNFNYVSIILSQENMNQNINSIRRTIEKAFSLYHIKPSFSSLIQGRYEGKLSPVQMNRSAQKIFLKNGGSSVKGIENDSIVSMSGFIPSFRDKIKADNRYVNLNIAMRYSETNGCTYIWIGSPIIAVEY